MKITVLFLNFIVVFAIFSGNAFAATYYVSNAGSDSNSGLSEASPWKTLSKISLSSSTGDTILLKRGDIWREELVIPASGMTISAYGTGNKPIISGADVVTGSWTLDSGNVYYTTVPGTVYSVLQDGKWVIIAHEPDGYNKNFYIDGKTKIHWQLIETGNDMVYQPSDLQGATLVGMTAQWGKLVYKIDRYDSAQDIIYLVQDGRTNGSIGLFDGTYLYPSRYWLSNKRIFLDSENEWYHDKANNRLYVYQRGGGIPKGSFEVSKRTNAISATGKSGLIISNIDVRNAVNGINLNKCVQFLIDNVDVNDIGTQTYLPGWESYTTSFGIYIRGTADLAQQGGTIRNSHFNNVLIHSLSGSNYDNVLVEKNTITNNAVVGEDSGFGPYGSMNSAITVGTAEESENWIIQDNYINGSGYGGIYPARKAIVERNTILNTMKHIGDGGAIYAGLERGGLIIRNNYIDGTRGGFGNTKTGIYIDGTNHDNLIANNTVLNTEFCLFNNGGSNNIWVNNTCREYTEYGFYAAVFILVSSSNINGLVFKSNKLSSSKAYKSHVVFYTPVSGQVPHRDWSQAKDFDYNSYYPGTTSDFYESYPPVYKIVYPLSGWQVLTGFDIHSSILGNAACVPSWTCGSWSSWSVCENNEQTRTRICQDTNGCNTITDKPSIQETQSCSIPQTRKLVGWWTMDAADVANGKIVDKSGNGYDALIHGNPSQVMGKVGGAEHLDGIDDYLDTGLKDHLAHWTIALWVKGDTIPSDIDYGGPIMKHENFILSWNHKNQIFRNAAGMRNGGTWYPASFNSLNKDTWYFLAASYDGETLKAYKNGILISENTDPSGDADNSVYPMLIGKHAVSDFFFMGSVDEVKVFNYALTAEEILQMGGSTSCAHSADNSPCDGCVTVTELGSYLSRWKNNEEGVTLTLIMEAIKEWKGGC